MGLLFKVFIIHLTVNQISYIAHYLLEDCGSPDGNSEQRANKQQTNHRLENCQFTTCIMCNIVLLSNYKNTHISETFKQRYPQEIAPCVLSGILDQFDKNHSKTSSRHTLYVLLTYTCIRNYL